MTVMWFVGGSQCVYAKPLGPPPGWFANHTGVPPYRADRNARFIGCSLGPRDRAQPEAAGLGPFGLRSVGRMISDAHLQWKLRRGWDAPVYEVFGVAMMALLVGVLVLKWCPVRNVWEYQSRAWMPQGNRNWRW